MLKSIYFSAPFHTDRTYILQLLDCQSCISSNVVSSFKKKYPDAYQSECLVFFWKRKQQQYAFKLILFVLFYFFSVRKIHKCSQTLSEFSPADSVVVIHDEETQNETESKPTSLPISGGIYEEMNQTVMSLTEFASPTETTSSLSSTVPTEESFQEGTGVFKIIHHVSNGELLLL